MCFFILFTYFLTLNKLNLYLESDRKKYKAMIFINDLGKNVNEW